MIVSHLTWPSYPHFVRARARCLSSLPWRLPRSLPPSSLSLARSLLPPDRCNFRTRCACVRLLLACVCVFANVPAIVCGRVLACLCAREWSSVKSVGQPGNTSRDIDAIASKNNPRCVQALQTWCTCIVLAIQVLVLIGRCTCIEARHGGSCLRSRPLTTARRTGWFRRCPRLLSQVSSVCTCSTFSRLARMRWVDVWYKWGFVLRAHARTHFDEPCDAGVRTNTHACMHPYRYMHTCIQYACMHTYTHPYRCAAGCIARALQRRSAPASFTLTLRRVSFAPRFCVCIHRHARTRAPTHIIVVRCS